MALLLRWLWQAPQNIVGLVFRLVYRNRTLIVVKDRSVDFCIVPSFPGGISLGQTVIVREHFIENPNAWSHEYGHCRQSLILGPLYLIVIGIPSLIWAWIHTPRSKISYYGFYTEKWADKLGGVKR